MMAGTTNKFNKWRPIPKPITYAINTIHRSDVGSSFTRSHFKIAQNAKAIKQDEAA